MVGRRAVDRSVCRRQRRRRLVVDAVPVVGWIAINNHTTAQTHTFDTGLHKGTYGDITHGNISQGVCSGPTIKVDKRGKACVTVQGKDTVAFTAKDLAHS